jgi:hypothetical protein
MHFILNSVYFRKGSPNENLANNSDWALAGVAGIAGTGIRSDIAVRRYGFHTQPDALAGHAGRHDRLE